MRGELKMLAGHTGYYLADWPVLQRLIACPLMPLSDHERAGGHTLERHVHKTVGYLKNRLKRNPGMPYASTFWNESIARASINHVISRKMQDILTWFSTSSTKEEDFQETVPVVSSVGVVLIRHTMEYRFLRDAKVVLRRGLYNDLYILTAFPTW